MGKATEVQERLWAALLQTHGTGSEALAAALNAEHGTVRAYLTCLVRAGLVLHASDEDRFYPLSAAKEKGWPEVHAMMLETRRNGAEEARQKRLARLAMMESAFGGEDAPEQIEMTNDPSSQIAIEVQRTITLTVGQQHLILTEQQVRDLHTTLGRLVD